MLAQISELKNSYSEFCPFDLKSLIYIYKYFDGYWDYPLAILTIYLEIHSTHSKSLWFLSSLDQMDYVPHLIKFLLDPGEWISLTKLVSLTSHLERTPFISLPLYFNGGRPW
jgi:hypothetical protein